MADGPLISNADTFNLAFVGIVASMFAGFSPALLNMFCERGVDGLKEMTPWKMLNETLNHARYRNFEMWGY